MAKHKAPSPPFIAARHHGGNQTPKAIVLHGTVSPCDAGRARSIAKWWAGPTSPVTSAHYIVDPGEVIQAVGDHTIAYHCGYNTGSIGVELCDPQTGPGSRWHDKAHRDMLTRAQHLMAQLCLAYGIDPHRSSVASLKKNGPHGIYDHNASRLAFGHTTHVDVGPDFPWESFLDGVRREVTAANKPKRKPSRGTNVDAAVKAARKARRYAKKHHKPTRLRRLREALSWLKQIKKK